MVGERTTEGWRLRLVPQGAGRFATAAFLAFWLCGWAAGEAFALWFLVKGAIALLTGTPVDHGRPMPLGVLLFMALFLIVWLTLWTIGGIAAIATMFGLVWGEDRIEVASGQLTATWIRGPFRGRRPFQRDALRRIALTGRDDHMVLVTDKDRVDLSALGTRAQRLEALAELRAELGITETPSAAATLPRGWEEIITPEGERAVVLDVATRHAQARVASIVTLAFAAATLAAARDLVHDPAMLGLAIVLLTLTTALAIGTLWLARGRWEWRIGNGLLTLRKRYGGNVRDAFEARRLMLDFSTDSDSDRWYEVLALRDPESPPAPTRIPLRPARPKNSRLVARAMNDADGMRDLAAWLANEAGVPLDDLTTPEAQAAQLAQVQALLDQSKFGRWLNLKVVKPLSDRQQGRG